VPGHRSDCTEHLQEFEMQSGTMNVSGQPTQTDETDRLISSEKVESTAVYDRAGERLGTVHHLMVDKFTGHVEYAVMSFGGFLGMGESYHPLPWRALTYEPRLGGYLVNTDRSRLERAPHFTSNAMPDWTDRTYRSGVDDYWMTPL
jgi:hypothetical protein